MTLLGRSGLAGKGRNGSRMAFFTNAAGQVVYFASIRTDLCIMPMGVGQCFELNLIPIRRFLNDNATMDSVHVAVINNIGIGWQMYLVKELYF